MVRKLNYRDVKSEADILPLLLLGGSMGNRSKKAVFDACLKFYLVQHPEIPKGLENTYFKEFVEAQFDKGTLLEPASEVAFSCLPQAVTSSRSIMGLLKRHEQAKRTFMGHYDWNIKEHAA